MSAHFADADTVLCDAHPESVGLRPGPIAAAVDEIGAHVADLEGDSSLYPGVVGLMGARGCVVARVASGHSYLYRDATTTVPEPERIRATPATLYDLASVSKLFTSIVAVQLVERGELALEGAVASYLPEFATGGKGEVTVRQLLTHTSGLAALLPLWSAYDNPHARIAAVMSQPLDRAAGSTYLYSDLGLITVGVLVERVTGQRLDALVRERVTDPLGMSSTGYHPLLGWAERTQIAATEHQSCPPRGMVWGEVHDENAWSLGGVAGHAGVFSTADDLAVLAQTLLNGGTYRGRRILLPQSVGAMVTDVNTAFPGHAHGLGFEIDQGWYMAGMSSPWTAGHTGYTGTSLVIDFAAQSFAVLLSNRVHPSRWGGPVNPARQVWAQGLASAHPPPADGG